MAGRSELEERAARLRGLAWLLGAQSSDGSWGYRTGGAGYVEPTALATIALVGEPGPDLDAVPAVQRATEFLRSLQHPDGSWSIRSGDDEPSWMTGYAMWALARAERAPGAGPTRGPLDAAIQWLLAEPRLRASAEGVAAARRISRVDGTLAGWPWLVEDTPWAFPTALGLIAAGIAGRAAAPRVRQAVAYLYDRACEGGGWNVGNPYTFDKVYLPTLIDTAAVLLGLKAVGEGESDPVLAGLARLQAMLAKAGSPLGLSWGLIAATAHGVDLPAARTRLLARQSPDGRWGDGPFATALAALAVAAGPAV